MWPLKCCCHYRLRCHCIDIVVAFYEIDLLIPLVWELCAQRQVIKPMPTANLKYVSYYFGSFAKSIVDITFPPTINVQTINWNESHFSMKCFRFFFYAICSLSSQFTCKFLNWWVLQKRIMWRFNRIQNDPLEPLAVSSHSSAHSSPKPSRWWIKYRAKSNNSNWIKTWIHAENF